MKRKKVACIVGRILLVVLLLSAILYGGMRLKGWSIRELIIKKQLEEMYGVHIKSIEIRSDISLPKGKYHTIYNFEEDKKYYNFFAVLEGYDDYNENDVLIDLRYLNYMIIGYTDSSINVLCTNFDLYEYYDDIAEDISESIKEVCPDIDYTICYDKETRFFTPRYATYKEYCKNIRYSQGMDIHLFIPDSVSFEDVIRISYSLEKKNFPWEINYLSADKDLMELLSDYEIMDRYTDSDELERIFEIHFLDIKNETTFYNSRNGREYYLSSSNEFSNYKYSSNKYYFADKENKTLDEDFQRLSFIVDRGTEHEKEIFSGNDSVMGVAYSTNIDVFYLLLNENNIEETIGQYIGHELSICRGDECIYKCTIEENMILDDFAIRLPNDYQTTENGN